MARILIVENQLTSRIVLKVKLSAASHDVYFANDLNQLFAHIDALLPELIMLPLAIAGTTASDVLRSLAQHERAKDVPVIVSAPADAHDERVDVLNMGAADIIDLPFHDPLLLGRVRNALRASVTLDEFRRREETASDLGLNQEDLFDLSDPKICLIGSEAADLQQLQVLLSKEFGKSALKFAHVDRVLDRIQRGRRLADIYYISSQDLSSAEMLHITAEITSHPLTRDSRIVLRESDATISTVTALDVGARDLIPATANDEETLLRIRNQFRNKRRLDALKDTLEQGLELAVKDPLTGLFNRRYLISHTSRVAQQAVERQTPFSILLLDLDRFKTINDTFGHGAGDHVLATFSERLKSSTRGNDVLARIGGEEFLVVMPDTNVAAARKAADRLKAATTEKPIILPNSTTEVELTVSIGLVVWQPSDQVELSINDLIALADNALLASKASGRNMVTIGQSAA